MNVNESCVPPSLAFVGLPNWKVIQLLKWPASKGWEILSWYAHRPFASVWVNLIVYWLLLSVVFTAWYIWFGGAELMFGPKREDDDE